MLYTIQIGYKLISLDLYKQLFIARKMENIKINSLHFIRTMT